MDKDTKAKLDEELELEKEEAAEEAAIEQDKADAAEHLKLPTDTFVNSTEEILNKRGPITLDDLDVARDGRMESDIPMTDGYWEVLDRFRHGR